MIFIDDREHDLINEFVIQDIPHTVKRLLIGDIVCDKIVIERKTESDFISSIQDQRLKEQCYNMLNEYEKVFIIIEINESDPSSDMPRNAILGFIASIVARTPISILFVKNPSETAYLSSKICQKATDGGSFNFDVVKRRNVSDPFLEVLCLVPKVSLDRARRIKEHFQGNFNMLIKAEEKDICEIKGIGKGISGNIQDFLKSLNL